MRFRIYRLRCPKYSESSFSMLHVFMVDNVERNPASQERNASVLRFKFSKRIALSNTIKMKKLPPKYDKKCIGLVELISANQKKNSFLKKRKTKHLPF